MRVSSSVKTMTFLIYFLAVIGAAVVSAIALFFLAWGFIHVVARAEIRRKTRRAALTLAQTQ